MTLSEPYLVGRADTAAVAADESADFWAERVCRNQGTVRFRFADASTFRGSMAMQGYAGYLLIDVCSDGIIYSRTPKDIRRDDDASLRLSIPTTGVLNLRQEDNAVQVFPGQAALFTKTRPADFGQPQNTQAWVMNIPTGGLPFDIGDGPAVIDLRTGLGSVVAGMISELGQQRAAMDGLGFATACDVIVDLVKLCLRPPEGSLTTLGTVDTAVRDYVRRHAAEPELTPNVIAHNLGWSLRQVQLALQGTGTTPSELIRIERLDRARQLLRGASVDRTVAEIAYASGFRSLSAFGAAFKARYGLTPQEARIQ
ncbi:AraC family transcriptional regulator [Nocardia grenadensis]|uniref:AraC family transcriptional regulator n=1 Tax=Nocardia grenadensis TaxID=931537 RepID=UPI0007A39F3B|nr:AraC family transcriptional regulator [Nocardia grenadensis]